MTADTSRMDDAAFEALYEREARPLAALMLVFTGDRAVAEELTQEAFVRLYRASRRLHDLDQAAPYLRTIGCNLARSWHRRRQVADLHLPLAPAPGASAEREALLREEERELLAAVRALPERQRECIVLRYYADLAPAAISETLGLSVNSVKTHLRRGMESLRTLSRGEAQ